MIGRLRCVFRWLRYYMSFSFFWFHQCSNNYFSFFHILPYNVYVDLILTNIPFRLKDFLSSNHLFSIFFFFLILVFHFHSILFYFFGSLDIKHGVLTLEIFIQWRLMRCKIMCFQCWLINSYLFFVVVLLGLLFLYRCPARTISFVRCVHLDLHETIQKDSSAMK